jgi:hypothetical protein
MQLTMWRRSRECGGVVQVVNRSFGHHSIRGQDYLLVVEWQGYRDPTVLWRLASYCAWIGQRTPMVPVIGTVVYLAPAYDVGDTLEQTIDGIHAV